MVTTSCFADLMFARKSLDFVINGCRVDLQAKQVMKLRNPNERRLCEVTERQTQTRIQIDERQGMLYIRSSRDSTIEAKKQILQQLDMSERDVVFKDIQLQESGYPVGLMKALVIDYGANLEYLQEASNALSLNLILRQHIIRFQRTEETYNKLKQLIADKARVTTGRTISSTTDMTHECPACLGPVEEDDDKYIMEGCGHVYCRDCAKNLVENSLQNNNISVECAGEKCDECLALLDIENLLPCHFNKAF